MLPRSLILLPLLCLLWPAHGVAADTLYEVWTQYGGARLYYDALVRPRQLHMNGARWEDPALYYRLPPLYEARKQYRRSTSPQARPAPPTQPVPPAQPTVTGDSNPVSAPAQPQTAHSSDAKQ